MKNDKSRFVVGASDFYLSLFICHFSFDGKSFAFCKGFLCVLLGAHASCVPGVRNSEHAGSVRFQGRPPRTPRLCGEAFWLRLGCFVFICGFILRCFRNVRCELSVNLGMRTRSQYIMALNLLSRLATGGGYETERAVP